MQSNLEIHHRRSIRLRVYDYFQPGACFITICSYNRECLFGRVVGGSMRLNEYGKLVNFTWNDLPNHFSNIRLDAFVVMPNHVHGIILITDTDSTKPLKQPQPLPEIVRQFKTFSARRINQIGQKPWYSCLATQLLGPNYL